jgi:hypothetical protein
MKAKLKIGAIAILVIAVLVIPGCGWPNNYGFAKEEYFVNYVLKNISNSTPTNLGFDYGELAEYSTNLEIPGTTPGRYGNLYFCSWLLDPYSFGASCDGFPTDMPYDRTYYVLGKTIYPDGDIVYSEIPYWYDSSWGDWKFEVWGAYGLSNEERTIDRNSWNHFIKETESGERHNFSFFHLPMKFTSVTLNADYGYYALELKDILYPSENEYMFTELREYSEESPTYPVFSEYKNGDIVYSKILDNFRYYFAEYEYYFMGGYHDFNIGDEYSFKLDMPSYYGAWNHTIEGETIIQEEDHYLQEFPYISFIEAEPFIDPNGDKIIRFEIMDNGLGEEEDLELAIHYGLGDSEWMPIEPILNYPIVELNIGQLIQEQLNLRIETRFGSTSSTHTITPISIAQRPLDEITFDMAYYCGEDRLYELFTGCDIVLRGECTDQLGIDCSHLLFDLYLDGQYAYPVNLPYYVIMDPFETPGSHELKLKYEGFEETTYPFSFEINTTIEVFDPPIEIIGNYTDYGIDENGDELYEELAIEFDVEVIEAGNYYFSGNLEISDDTCGQGGCGGISVYAGSDEYLSEGIHTIQLLFSGIDIYREATDGPYLFDELVVYGGPFNLVINPEYQTRDYLYREFNPPWARLNYNFNDYGIDEDEDDAYDYLVVEVGVDVDIESEYRVHSYLSKDGEHLASYYIPEIHLAPGENTIELNFSGLQLYLGGEDGPYTLGNFQVSDVGAGEMLIFENDIYDTSSYNYTDFERPGAQFNGYFSDYGLDTNDNELYDHLIIEAGVSVNEPGEYILSGSIEVGEDHYSLWDNSPPIYLPPGDHTLNLSFLGLEIYDLETDGPYLLRYIELGSLEHGGIDYEDSAYNTSSYNYTDFEEFVTLNATFSLIDANGIYPEMYLEIERDPMSDYEGWISQPTEIDVPETIEEIVMAVYNLGDPLLKDSVGESLDLIKGEISSKKSQPIKIEEISVRGREGQNEDSFEVFAIFLENSTSQQNMTDLTFYEVYTEENIVDERNLYSIFANKPNWEFGGIENAVFIGYSNFEGNPEESWRIFYCDSWDFYSNECEGNWQQMADYEIEIGSGQIYAEGYNPTFSEAYALGYEIEEENCVEPTDGMMITEDTTFCSGTYEIPWGVMIDADNIQVTCDGTVFDGEGPRNNVGIDIQQVSDVLVQGCEFRNYDFPITIYDSNNIDLIRNKVRYAVDPIMVADSNNTYLEWNQVLNSDRGIQIYNSPTTELKLNRVFPGATWDVECFPAESSIIDGNGNICYTENCGDFRCHDKPGEQLPNFEAVDPDFPLKQIEEEKETKKEKPALLSQINSFWSRLLEILS